MCGVSNYVAKLRTDVLSAENLERIGHIFDFATLPVICGRPHITGVNPPYGILGRNEETSASFEARSAPRSYPAFFQLAHSLGNWLPVVPKPSGSPHLGS
jgi:hypothetical protein